MNITLQPGAVYTVRLGSDAMAQVLDALAAKPYAQVAPLMGQFMVEIARQNEAAAKAAAEPVQEPSPEPTH